MSETEDNVAVETTEAPIVERPEWLPEKFETPETMAEAYGQLESKLGQRSEDIKSELMQELEAEAYAGRPETADQYELPEGIPDGYAVDNDMLDWWKNYCFENGSTQEEFGEGFDKLLDFYQMAQPDLENEIVKLGDNAGERLEAVNLWVAKFFNNDEDMLEAISTLGYSANGIVALEKIMSAVRGSSLSQDSAPTMHRSREELEAMMLDPRYHKQGMRDPQFVKEVEDGFRLLGGG